MSFNLLDAVKDQVMGSLAGKAASFLGESESNVNKALGGIFPTILASLINKGNDKSGANDLMGMIGRVDNGITDNIGNLFGGGGPDKLLNSGTSILSSLMGNKLGGAVDLISKISGVKSGSAMSLFKMASPMLLGILGKRVSKNNLGADGLMSLLQDQKSVVQRELPAGMGAVMGLKDLFNSAKGAVTGAVTGAANTLKSTTTPPPAATPKTPTTPKTVVVENEPRKAEKVVTPKTTEEPKSGAGFMKWLIPLILLLGGIYLLTQTSMCADTKDSIESGADSVGRTVGQGADAVRDGATTAGNAVVDGARNVGNKLSAAFSNVNREAKATLDRLTFSAGSAGAQMKSYIERGEGVPLFRFKDLTFATGSARIDAESAREIEDIAAILKAYPDVRVEIQGFTDNTGDANTNRQLSKARAEAVKARLTTEGISSSRIEAEGYGSDDPIATNDTEEGRKKNRRIEVKVIN